MADQFYPTMGRCIYCGATDPTPGTDKLGDEHIIPYSLGGNMVIPEASCQCCEKIINHQIETPVTSHEWGLLRIKLNMQTRNRRKRRRQRRTHAPIRRLDGTVQDIPIPDHPTPVPLYIFHEPRILANPLGPKNNNNFTMAILGSGEAEAATRAKYPEWDGVHTFTAKPHHFARLIAKIAHGYATAELGHDCFRPLLVDLILGRTDDYFLFVGGTGKLEEPIPGGNHITNISINWRNGVGDVIVGVRLFSEARTPHYRVVAGQIHSHDPQHVVAMEKHRLNGRIKEAPFPFVQIPPIKPGRV